MEQILVGIDSQHGSWEALARACALARRIKAHLHILLVRRPEGAAAKGEPSEENALRRNLELRIESAKSQGIPISYYLSEGSYEEEVVRFIKHYRISLLVYESRDGEYRSSERAPNSLEAIRHRIACKVEIVAPRKINELS